MYNYKETVYYIDGLNSISTLKKWRLKIENLTGHQFQESRVRTGRKSYTKVFLFTDDDIDKLQFIADTKDKLGLDKAIIKAYAPSRDSPKLSLAQKFQNLLSYISKSEKAIKQSLKTLEEKTDRTSKQITALEERIIELEQRKGLFWK